MENRDLKEFYNRVYRRGERVHYTPFLFSGDKIPPAKVEVLREISWNNKRVLDAGCGTGELAYEIAKNGAAEVIGIDYSPEAIVIAQKKHQHSALSYQCKTIDDVGGRFDAVVSLGTLEHMDDPLQALRRLKSLLHKKGDLVLTCPNWLNPRGFVLMTLRFLFGAKITLADIHYFTPRDFEVFAKKLRLDLTWRTIDHDWAQGKKMVQDFSRRLPRVLADSTLPHDAKKITEFITWLDSHMVGALPAVASGGAVALYHFKKKN